MNTIHRDTKQRAAIRAALNTADRPLNVHEILEAAQRDVPNLGIATVYRNVKTMIGEGKLKAVEGIGIAPCYALPETAKPCKNSLYQIENSLHFTEPKGFVCESGCLIHIGHIG